jgi:hypothetical protein
MARAIVRYSCNNTTDKNEADRARAKIRKILTDAGFARVGSQKRGTASWELDSATPSAIGTALRKIFEVVEDLDPGVLDHVWTYCDE